MKALTILQPWASLIACGAKKIETRSWSTKYRGPLAIHAGKNANTPRCAWEEPFRSELIKAGIMRPNPYANGGYSFSLKHNGFVIAIADLVDCKQVEGLVNGDFGVYKIEFTDETRVYGKNEIAFGDYAPGRYAWMLENVRMIEPVPAKGMQRLWNWEPPAKNCQHCDEIMGCYESCLNRKGCD